MFGKKKRIIQTQAKNMERYRAELEDLRKTNGTLRESYNAVQKYNNALLLKIRELQANLNAMTETAAQHEQDFIAANTENRELQARLLCYQGVEKLLFTAAAKSAPAAEQEDSGKEADEEMQPPPNPTKPAKLLTVGGVVTWLGETFVIERFAVGEDNQTDAIIKNDRAMLCVPVEDLETVEE